MSQYSSPIISWNNNRRGQGVGEDKVHKFQERFEEGYDVGTDELYTVWLQMKKKKLSLKETPNLPAAPEPPEPSHSSPDGTFKF